MIFLGTFNTLIHEYLTKRYTDEKIDNYVLNTCDFDQVKFQIVPEEKKKNILICSIKVEGEEVLKKYGMENVLKSHYKDLYLDQPEKGFTASLKLDTSDEKMKDFVLKEVPLFKRYVMLSPFKYVFEKMLKGEEVEQITLPYRPNENMYIFPNSKDETVQIIFSILFKDNDDIVLAGTFLQEFRDSRRERSLSDAPSVSFTEGTKPLDLKSIKSNEPDDPKELKKYGFMTFGLFPAHYENEKKVAKSVDNLISFRNYFHYHLKCYKAYMHFRMRDRFSKLEKMKNASMDLHGQKKQKASLKTQKYI